jgi:hypothetical protein
VDVGRLVFDMAQLYERSNRWTSQIAMSRNRPGREGYLLREETVEIEIEGAWAYPAGIPGPP